MGESDAIYIRCHSFNFETFMYFSEIKNYSRTLLNVYSTSISIPLSKLHNKNYRFFHQKQMRLLCPAFKPCDGDEVLRCAFNRTVTDKKSGGWCNVIRICQLYLHVLFFNSIDLLIIYTFATLLSKSWFLRPSDCMKYINFYREL